MIRVQSNYSFGDEVYVKTDPEQLKRQVIGIMGSGIPGEQPLIKVTLNGQVDYFFEIELSTEPDIMMRTTS